MASQTVDLRAQVVNVKVIRGDAWALAVTFPGDLTGAEVIGHVRPEATSSQVESLEVTLTDPATGQFSYGQLAASDGFYDVQITPLGGGPRTWIRGRITTEQDVTRA